MPFDLLAEEKGAFGVEAVEWVGIRFGTLALVLTIDMPDLGNDCFEGLKLGEWRREFWLFSCSKVVCSGDVDERCWNDLSGWDRLNFGCL